LDAFIDLPLSVPPEVVAAEVTFFKSGIRGDFTSQSPFIQCNPYDNANVITFTCGKEPIFRALFENIIDDLNSVYNASLDEFETCSAGNVSIADTPGCAGHISFFGGIFVAT
jgi:hypothetical protein